MERNVEVISIRRSRRNSTDEENRRPDTGKGIIEDLLQGARQLTLAALYVGCGATVLVWETVEGWSKSFYSGVRPLWNWKRDEKTPAPKRNKIILFPIDHYDRMKVYEVLERLPRLSKSELQQTRAYEKEHRNRSGVLSAIDRRLAEAE